MKQTPHSPPVNGGKAEAGHPQRDATAIPADLFGSGKVCIEPKFPDPKVTFYGFHKFSRGQIEISVGRADLSQDIVLSVVDPDRGPTQILLSSQELAQEALRIHRERCHAAELR